MKNFLKFLIFITLVFCLSGCAYSQETITRKIKIRSADPQLIAMILSGKLDFLSSPVPTSLNHMGNSNSNFGGGGFNNSGG